MPRPIRRITLTLPKDLGDELHRQAAAKGISISSHIVNLLFGKRGPKPRRWQPHQTDGDKQHEQKVEQP